MVIPEVVKIFVGLGVIALIDGAFVLYKRNRLPKKVKYSEKVSDNMAQIINPDNPLDGIEL